MLLLRISHVKQNNREIMLSVITELITNNLNTGKQSNQNICENIINKRT